MTFGWVLVLLGCAPAPVVATDWGALKQTQSGKYRVGLEFVPVKPPSGELFEVAARFTEDNGTPIEDGSVTLNARMPQHNHGMMTDPINDPGQCPPATSPGGATAGGRCRHPGGLYKTSGFKFHMGGEWTITVEVVGPRGPDSTSFVYNMP